MALHPTWKRILVQRRRGFAPYLFPFPLARNKENGNIESRILMGCEPCTDTGLYSAGFKEKIDVDEAVF